MVVVAILVAVRNFGMFRIPHCDVLIAVLSVCCLSALAQLIHGKATLLFSLDLSAAFDTIDHSLLLCRLSHSFGFTGSAIMWVQSYLSGRSQTVRLGSHCSSCTLGPLLFAIYTSSISHIAESHNIQQHQYADDTQLFVALTSKNVHAQVSALESCLSSLQAWFCSNSMIMNPDKSNSILFATTQHAHSIPDQISVSISGVSIPLCMSCHVMLPCRRRGHWRPCAARALCPLKP